jgi:hypothetical protein
LRWFRPVSKSYPGKSHILGIKVGPIALTPTCSFAEILSERGRAMSWMNERDALIAQTMAFVEQVAGKMPETMARVEIVPIDAIQRVERPVQVEVPRSNRPVSTVLTFARKSEAGLRPSVRTSIDLTGNAKSTLIRF